MSTSQHPVVLPSEALAAGNEAVVDANVDVVNAMYEELLDEREIAEDALRSYYVDFYLTQSLDGGFAQYVASSGDHHGIDAYVRDGLRAMGAEGHLALFEELVAAFEALSEEDAEAYLDGDDEVEAVAALESLDDRFEPLLAEEDLVALNGAWLRGSEGLLALDEEGIEDEIARRMGLIEDLEERRAAAEEDSLADVPDFELVIRELCDPNYVHHGIKTVAWRFTTDQGEYVMVEEDDEAYMIDPATREILAAVEFEELDEDELDVYEDDPRSGGSRGENAREPEGQPAR